MPWSFRNNPDGSMKVRDLDEGTSFRWSPNSGAVNTTQSCKPVGGGKYRLVYTVYGSVQENNSVDGDTDVYL